MLYSSVELTGNDAFLRDERILLNNVATRLKCKLHAHLQIAVYVSVFLRLLHLDF